MTKKLKNILITMFSLLMCLLFGMTLFLPSTNTVKAESGDFTGVDTINTPGYYERVLTQEESYLGKTVRVYKGYDSNNEVWNFPSYLDFGPFSIDQFNDDSLVANFDGIWGGDVLYYSYSPSFIDIYFGEDFCDKVSNDLILGEEWTEEDAENYDWKSALTGFQIGHDINDFISDNEGNPPVDRISVYVVERLEDTTNYIETEIQDGDEFPEGYYRFYAKEDGTYGNVQVLEHFQSDGMIGFDFNPGTGLVSDEAFGEPFRVGPYFIGDNYVDVYFNFQWILDELEMTSLYTSYDDFRMGEVSSLYGMKAYKLSAPVEELPEEPSEEPGMSEENKGWIDKITDYVNENTGWAITSSTMSIVLIVVVLYVLFRKK